MEEKEKKKRKRYAEIPPFDWSLLSPEEIELNENWTKQGWDLPVYKTPEFFRYIESVGMTLEEFKEKTAVYKIAVKQGRIIDDEWNPNFRDEPHRRR